MIIVMVELSSVYPFLITSFTGESRLPYLESILTKSFGVLEVSNSHVNVAFSVYKSF